MKSVTFTGTRGEVEAKAAAWKAANPQAHITAGWPMVAHDMDDPATPHDKPIWSCTIHYKEPHSN